MEKTVTLKQVKDVLRPPERILALEAERNQIAAAYKKYKKTHGQIEQLIAEVLAAVPSIKPKTPIYTPPEEKKAGSDISVVVHITESHYGEVQKESEIEGFGTYSPEISKIRQFGFIRDVLDWVEMHRLGYKIPECRMLVTGDLISGDIHDELRVTNAFPAPKQAVDSGEILAKQTAMVAPYFKRVIVDVITTDNHGRLTPRSQAKEGGLNNWMFVVASIAKQLLRQHKNVEFNIYAQPEKVVSIQGRRYLLCHGHDVTGWAGFPYYGIERKTAREALKRMNAPDVTKFDKIIMGHWHAPLAHPYYWIGGSVSGTSTYDHQAGRHAEPQQVSWFVHPKWGEFDRTCWQLRKYDSRE